MNNRISTVFVALFALIFAVPANATVVSLVATDTGSKSSNGSIWNDDRVRAYTSSSGGWKADGFMKFDLSGIDDFANVTSMVLTTKHEAGFGNPYQDPQVRIYRSTNDSWTRSSTTYPGLNEVLTPVHNGFPSLDLVPYLWTLDLNAFNWTADLVDNTLSLAMRNVKSTYSYVYWHGSDNPANAPTLTIEYNTDVPEPMALALFVLGLAGLGFRARKRN